MRTWNQFHKWSIIYRPTNLYHIKLSFLSKVYLIPSISTPQYEKLYKMIIMYYPFIIRIHSNTLNCLDMCQSLPCPKCTCASDPS